MYLHSTTPCCGLTGCSSAFTILPWSEFRGDGEHQPWTVLTRLSDAEQQRHCQRPGIRSLSSQPKSGAWHGGSKQTGEIKNDKGKTDREAIIHISASSGIPENSQRNSRTSVAVGVGGREWRRAELAEGSEPSTVINLDSRFVSPAGQKWLWEKFLYLIYVELFENLMGFKEQLFIYLFFWQWGGVQNNFN